MGHKFYRLGGGIDKYFLDLCALMKAHAHQVISFAMHDEDNLPSEYSQYFAPTMKYGEGRFSQRLKSFAHFVYSPAARRQIDRLVQETKPQIAHFQHVYHQLTTAVFEPLRKRGIPIVQGVHDYKLGCPRYTLFNTRTGELCDACKGHNYVHAVLQRCYDGSLMRSALVAVESYYNRLFKTYQRSVDRFIVSNDHMKGRLVRYGIDAARIRILPNFVELPENCNPGEHSGFFLYFGRLSLEKGVEHLLQAMQHQKAEKLVIVGNGPDEARLKKLSESLGLANVEFVGPLWGPALQPVLEAAMCVIVPSVWHENSPMVIYQSFAAGKPVIATRRGGIPDLVEHAVSGLLFEAGNVAELVQCMQEIARSPEKQASYGQQGRLKAEREYTAEIHYNRLLEIYRELGVTS